ncbi:MAG: hypothetical protein ACKKL6_03155 [Candidatus Komeilibacteria bacterium]
MNERKAQVNKYPSGRFRSREYNLDKNTRVVCYPSDHRTVEQKGLTKFIRNWLF